MASNFVAYYRVSTERQGQSGLGLEAQQEAVRSYLNGGRWKLVAEVVEVESGKNSQRPKLTGAIRLAKLHKATLIIAKLDRLARNVHFVSSLMESGVEFTAVDFPQANRLTIHILAAVAEHEAAMISARTKAALAAAKARGMKLGGFRGHTFTAEHHEAALRARQAGSEARAAELAPVIAELRSSGLTSLHGLARALTERGIPTARGGSTWAPVQVARVLERIGSAG
ncbi:recombinase family protein [uncultured Enterovirga sp.]|uniref:recombinase family protein n=1 Tax=uncultured Enterovirga sp. TaxID=2026352 RepID=UPI0035CA8E3F